MSLTVSPGESHPSTLDAMSDLAFRYQQDGRIAEAEKLFREAPTLTPTLALALNSSVRPRESGRSPHPPPVTSALSCPRSADHPGEALATWLYSAGARDPSTLSATHDLAMLLKERKQLDEAAGLLRKLAPHDPGA